MKLGFVGAGNMATGIARGLAVAKGEAGVPESMLFTDVAPVKAGELARQVRGEMIKGVPALAQASDLVVLAVKPNVLDDVAPDLVEAGKPVISILAGTTLATLGDALPGLTYVRVMPNLGVQLRLGVLCVAFEEGTGEDFRDEVLGLLALLGDVMEIEEDLMDPATAIMGCSPGYLALMAEVLVEEGIKEGLSPDQVLRMVARSMAATGGLLDLHQPATLKQAVASPGGMTEAGLNALEENSLRQTLRAAVDASLQKVRG
jgi:pyrroline-5-carboxylate reductase